MSVEAGKGTVRPLHVAVGVVCSPQGLILIAQRPAQVHLGGKWEFPGGKVEPGETAGQALQRELHEELGIEVQQAEPLIQLHHPYPEKPVLLDVWRVTRFRGVARGCEGQPVRWVSPHRLGAYDFPAANHAIIAATRLPRIYPILNDSGDTESRLLEKLDSLLSSDDVQMIQYRAPALDNASYQMRASVIAERCAASGVEVIINHSIEMAASLPVRGVHLNSVRLQTLPVDFDRPEGMLVSCACHSLQELALAHQRSMDFALLSPVMPTPTHPGVQGLGWELFSEWVATARLPVYALGGMLQGDLARALGCGAQGIAGITTFLRN